MGHAYYLRWSGDLLECREGVQGQRVVVALGSDSSLRAGSNSFLGYEDAPVDAGDAADFVGRSIGVLMIANHVLAKLDVAHIVDRRTPGSSDYNKDDLEAVADLVHIMISDAVHAVETVRMLASWTAECDRWEETASA